VKFMTTSSRIRRAATVGGCAVTALAAAGTAQAQAVHAGTVPQAKPSASLQGAPSGRPTKVRNVEGSVTPDTYEGCDAGFFCLAAGSYPNAGQSPSSWYLVPDARLHGGTGYSYPWGECSPNMYPGCDAGIHAFANNTGDRVWLKAYPTGGKELCITNHTWSSSYDGIADEDYWVQITTNPNPC
jgi:hypothetical protein